MEFLVRELAELREMLVGMKRAVTGHGLEGKEGEAGDREVGLEEQEKGEGFLAPDDPASTLTIRQPKPNRWFNVGPTATYLVGPTLLCSLDKRWPNINFQPKPNQAPTITQHCPNYHQP